MCKEGLTDPDEVPEPPDEAITQPGDLWVLGDHRLLCGDSSQSGRSGPACSTAQPIHLLNTDPPYNVKVEPRSNNAIAAGNSSFKQTHHQKMDLARHPEKSKPTSKKMRAKDRPLENDFVSDEEFDRLLDAWFGNAAACCCRAVGFTFGAATPTVRTIPRSSRNMACIFRRPSSGTNSTLF